MNTASPYGQPFLVHVLALPTIPSPITLCVPFIAFARYPSAQPASCAARRSELRLRVAGRPWLAESSLLSQGLLVYLLLSPTPSHVDARTVSYRPESVYLERAFTFLCKHAVRRPSPAKGVAWLVRSPQRRSPRGFRRRAKAGIGLRNQKSPLVPSASARSRVLWRACPGSNPTVRNGHTLARYV